MIDYRTPAPTLRIQDMGLSERPREKLRMHGSRLLSDSELVAVILGNGKRGVSALDLARTLLLSVGHDLHDLARRDIDDLTVHPGLGEVKAIRLIAALELGRRRENAFVVSKPYLGNSEQSFRFLRPIIGDLEYEEFHILCLNRANHLLGCHQISDGGVTATIADAKRIFRKALSHASVTSVVLAHNHPSGQPFPSEADIQLTRKLSAAARHLDLFILDHLIIAGRKYYSFADDGLLGDNS
ncbi:RadC family protein [Neolewinella antarctica]|uniref:DNA repair protein RadC n=1 Tax=Neolewinella antarctica TaxID=442734 RepID=A0ABX0XE95_9BACT|nr:DNA repair protein RadC [Neolewinella antarctica]NJC27229.1 DNA repair protein RadC [Neolewinella antarctica]